MAGELSARLKVRRGRFTLDVDLVFPIGITAIVGPSGAGKSTLLGALVGALHPDEGRIALGDRVWFEASSGARPRVALPPEARHVGVVFQSLALFPHMTAEQNVGYGISGAPALRREAARAWLERLGVLHLADRRPRSYSGGEAQRVALARALAPGPSVLVLDEPFSALDDATKAHVLRELTPTLLHEGRVVVCVTHREDELGGAQSSTVRLEGGELRERPRSRIASSPGAGR